MYGSGDLAREISRAELHALCDALNEAAGATLFAPDLDADEISQGLADVVRLWSDEVARRIPGWVNPGEARTDTDPDTSTASTDEENPVRNPLSDKDQKAVELAKLGRRNPELKERVRKVDEARAGKESIEKMHPVSKMAENSPVLAEYENEVLEIMSKEKCSFELAVGLLARDPAYHVMKSNYKAEQRALRGA